MLLYAVLPSKQYPSTTPAFVTQNHCRSIKLDMKGIFSAAPKPRLINKNMIENFCIDLRNIRELEKILCFKTLEAAEAFVNFLQSVELLNNLGYVVTNPIFEINLNDNITLTPQSSTFSRNRLSSNANQQRFYFCEDYFTLDRDKIEYYNINKIYFNHKIIFEYSESNCCIL